MSCLGGLVMGAIRLVFAVASYLLFFATFLYLAAFVGNLFVPKTIDAGGVLDPIPAAVVDVFLISLFGLQHSVMARSGFKRKLTQFVHPSIERSVYVLATVGVLWIMFALWQPIPAVVWAAEGTAAVVLWALFAIGWTIVFLSTWMLDHFELFGLRQAWFGFTGKNDHAPKFREPMFYRYVRHPLYFGMLMAFWAIPVMTVGHLLFASVMSVYVLMAIRWEERDLTHALGEAYTDYRKRVGMIVPGIGKAR